MNNEKRLRYDLQPVVLGAVSRRGSGEEDIVLTTGEKNLGIEIGDTAKAAHGVDDETE